VCVVYVVNACVCCVSVFSCVALILALKHVTHVNRRGRSVISSCSQKPTRRCPTPQSAVNTTTNAQTWPGGPARASLTPGVALGTNMGGGATNMRRRARTVIRLRERMALIGMASPHGRVPGSVRVMPDLGSVSRAGEQEGSGLVEKQSKRVAPGWRRGNRIWNGGVIFFRLFGNCYGYRRRCHALSSRCHVLSSRCYCALLTSAKESHLYSPVEMTTARKRMPFRVLLQQKTPKGTNL
jgi:hypothetical protein